MSGGADKRRKHVPWREAIALTLGSVLVGLLLGEVGIRIVHPSASLWHYPNYIELATRPDPDQPVELLQYDPQLGYEPRANVSGVLMHQPVSYSSDGLRNHNLGRQRPEGPLVLAVGDGRGLHRLSAGRVETDRSRWLCRVLCRQLGKLCRLASR